MVIAANSRAHQAHPQPVEWADQRTTLTQQHHLSIPLEQVESHLPPLPLLNSPNITIPVRKLLKEVVALQSSNVSGKTRTRTMNLVTPLQHNHPNRSLATGRREQRRNKSGKSVRSSATLLNPVRSPAKLPNQPKGRSSLVKQHIAAPE